MKINEVIVEGFWSGLGRGLGAVGKGLVKGASDAVAPGAWDEIAKSARQSSAARSSTQQGVSKAGNVRFQGNEYTWLGNQWGLVNPQTGKAVPAPKAVQDQLNFLSTRRMPDFSSMSDEELMSYASLGKRAWPQQLKAEIAKRQGAQQQAQQQAQQAQQPATPTAPAGEAQSAADLVDRLYKLHPDWAPQVAQEIIKRSTTGAAPK